MCQIQRRDKQAGKDFTDITAYIFYFDLTSEITAQDFSESWGLVSRPVTVTHGPMRRIQSDSRRWITLQQLLVLRCQQLSRVSGHEKNAKKRWVGMTVTCTATVFIHSSILCIWIHTNIYIYIVVLATSQCCKFSGEQCNYQGGLILLKEASSSKTIMFYFLIFIANVWVFYRCRVG